MIVDAPETFRESGADSARRGRRVSISTVASPNWICDTCSLHYASGRLVPPPRKCERCENKAFEIY